MDRQQRLDAALQELTKEPGVSGAAIVSRDGLLVRASGRLSLSRETFSAMAATAMGAAEIAISELDGGKPRHMSLVTDRMRLVAVGATRDLLLVVVAQLDASEARLAPRIEAAAQNIGLIATGG